MIKDPVLFGLSRGELITIGVIFGLIYTAGLLPKIAAKLSGAKGGPKQGSGD